jgi:hypothetical protein
MKLFDMGYNATGVVAVGQAATGFFAFGQGAKGVIAVGQFALGGIAVGQFAFGLIGWGQFGGGIFSAAGMFGIGGRRPLGAVLPLVPSIGRPRVMPEATPFEVVQRGGTGWVEADLGSDGVGLGLFVRGQRLPVKLDRRVCSGAEQISLQRPCRVSAWTRPIGGTLVCDRIAYAPPRLSEQPGFAVRAAAQLLGLVILATVWSAVCGHDLMASFGWVGRPAPAQQAPASHHRR